MIHSRFSGSFLAALAVAATAALLLSGTAHAQSTTSSIRVVVTDDGGAAVSGVEVSIRHVPTGRIQTTMPRLCPTLFWG